MRSQRAIYREKYEIAEGLEEYSTFAKTFSLYQPDIRSQPEEVPILSAGT